MKIIDKIKSFFNSKYLVLIKQLLSQGISPREIALGIAGGFVIGVFPVLGSTTILSTIFAMAFRLNLPLVQLVNFSVYPLQIILLVPFMKLGEYIFGFDKLNYSLNEIVDLIGSDVLNAISILWNVTMQAIGAWVAVAPFAAFVLFLIFLKLINKIKIAYVKIKSDY